MKTSIVLTSALVALSVAVMPAAALPCNGVITTISEGGVTVYVDDRSGGNPTINHWVYAESGRLAGLQSGGNHPVLGSLGADPCRHPVAAERDILII